MDLRPLSWRITASVAAVILFGWAFYPPLSRLGFDVRAKPDAALSVLLLAAALRLAAREGAGWRARAGLLAGAAGLIGTFRSIQYCSEAFGSRERFLTAYDPYGSSWLSPMAPMAAVGVALLAAALLGTSARPGKPKAWQVCALGAMTVGLAGLFTAAYGVQGASPRLTVMSPWIGGCLVLLGGAAFLLRPAEGFAAVFVADTAGGAMLRRLAVPAFLVPLVIGWGRLQAERAGLLDPAEGVLLVAVSSAVLLAAISIGGAEALHAKELGGRAAEQRFQRVIESSPDAMIVSDARGRVTMCNPRAEALLGYSASELEGLGVEALVPDAARARHVAQREGYQHAPRPRPMGAGLDLRARRKDGTEVPVEISLSPMPTPEGVMVVATIRDVTEQRRTREALRQSVQALQRSNEALEQFAFIASHDLQEPLRKVSSYCQLLERRYADKLDSDGKDFIRYAVDGAARMRHLIQDLLTYSRVGRQETPWERVDLSEACGRALEALQPAIAEAGARVSVGELPAVRGRATALAQAFQNLIGNALKFRSERPLELRIDAGLRDREWVVSVSDNGIGIEAKHRERVFEVFERLHPHARYPGTGIGLAIVKRVVEQHGGRVWADETPGGGSTFHFTLPVAEEA